MLSRVSTGEYNCSTLRHVGRDSAAMLSTHVATAQLFESESCRGIWMCVGGNILPDARDCMRGDTWIQLGSPFTRPSTADSPSSHEQVWCCSSDWAFNIANARTCAERLLTKDRAWMRKGCIMI
nr:hypothetical protein CFP56_04030 [Quercus suber]